MQLAKHTAGKPLTQAELEQRREAAKARWRNAAAAAAAGAAGGLAGHLALRRAQRVAAGKIEATHAIVARAEQRNDARRARLDAAIEGTAQRLRGGTTEGFLGRARRGLASQHRRADNDVRTHFRDTSEWILLGDGTEVRGTFDFDRRAELHRIRDGHARELEDLVTNGRPTRRVPVAANAGAQVAEHTRMDRRRVTAWSTTAHDQLAHTLAAFGLEPPTVVELPEIQQHTPRETPQQAARRQRDLEAGIVRPEPARRVPGRTRRQAAQDLRDHQTAVTGWLREAGLPGGSQVDPREWIEGGRLTPDAEAVQSVRRVLQGVRSLADVDRLTHGMTAANRRTWLRQHLLPHDPTAISTVPVLVPAHRRGGTERTTRRVEGYPGREGRDWLQRTLQWDVRVRGTALQEQESRAALWRTVHARMQQRAAAHAPTLRLSALRSPAARVAAVALPALASAGLGYGLSAAWSKFGMGKLAKAAPRKRRTRVVSDTEAEVGRRLAASFAELKDEADRKLSGGGGANLLDIMQDRFAEALEPLDDAAHAGGDAVALLGSDPTSLAFSMQARSPHVQQYVEQHRDDRVAELVDEQRQVLKQRLIDAVTSGASADELARRVKEGIGLTAAQAQAVQNYRAELEGLAAGALTRQLRDKRFDPTVAKAREAGKALSADQVEKMVGAYHRKFLALRAMTIARTESLSAASNGQMASARAMLARHPGYVAIKGWQSTKDERTRHDHAELNGQEVEGLDTPFRCDSGDLIQHPHDPAAPARQVINCRCSWYVRIVRRGAG